MGAIIPAHFRVKVMGEIALLLSDQILINGCAFMMGMVPSPCMRVQWIIGSNRVRVDGEPVVLDDTVGHCVSAAGAVQGNVTITNRQVRCRGE
jgi:hypothetical protein